MLSQKAIFTQAISPGWGGGGVRTIITFCGRIHQLKQVFVRNRLFIWDTSKQKKYHWWILFPGRWHYLPETCHTLKCRGGIKDSSYDQYDQTKPVYCATNPCLYSSLPRSNSNVIACMHCPRTVHAYFSVSDSCDITSHAHQTPPQDLVCLANGG